MCFLYVYMFSEGSNMRLCAYNFFFHSVLPLNSTAFIFGYFVVESKTSLLKGSV